MNQLQRIHPLSFPSIVAAHGPGETTSVKWRPRIRAAVGPQQADGSTKAPALLLGHR